MSGNSPKQRENLGRVIACILTAIISVSCQSFSYRDEGIEEIDALYQSYLEGDKDIARSSLLSMSRLLEDIDFEKKTARAHGLCLTYLRLHLLERRTGNDVGAEGYLLKARYWYLVKSEQMGSTIEEAMDSLLLDVSNLCQFADNIDKRKNNGNLPNYITGINE